MYSIQTTIKWSPFSRWLPSAIIDFWLDYSFYTKIDITNGIRIRKIAKLEVLHEAVAANMAKVG